MSGKDAVHDFVHDFVSEYRADLERNADSDYPMARIAEKLLLLENAE